MDNKTNIRYTKNIIWKLLTIFIHNLYKKYNRIRAFLSQHNIRNIPQDNINKIKTKIRSTCKKYSQINVPYENRKIVKDLSNNKSIIILLQDKGRGFVTMDRRFDMLNTEQLIKLPNDPTNYIEKKIQRNLRKIKQKLPKDYHTLSNRVIISQI